MDTDTNTSANKGAWVAALGGPVLAVIGLLVVRWAHTSVNPFDEVLGNEVVVSPVALTIGWGLVAVGAILLLAGVVGLVSRR